MRISILILSVFAAFLTGCGALQLSPIVNETRDVKSVSDAAKTLSVREGMVWYDGSPATRGLRFPPGTYSLEAEDAEYWYLRSSSPLELRVFQNNRVVDARNIPGGIMIAKHFSIIPGAGYIDGEGTTKVMIWKLGSDFLNKQGRDWQKTF